MKAQNNNKYVNRVNNLNLIKWGLSINIYHRNNQYKIYPLSITKDEKENHIDLLFLKDDKGKTHYCLIKDLWKLVGRHQLTKDHKKRYLCKMCLNSFPCEKVLSDHKNYCGLNKPAKVILPDKADNIVEFKNYNHSMKAQFAIYVTQST